MLKSTTNSSISLMDLYPGAKYEIQVKFTEPFPLFPIQVFVTRKGQKSEPARIVQATLPTSIGQIMLTENQVLKEYFL